MWNFRLYRVWNIVEHIREKQVTCSQTYSKYAWAIEEVTTVVSGIAVGTRAGGAILISTGVGMPMGAVLEGLAVPRGIVSIIGCLGHGHLSKKAQKHDRIAQTTSAILATLYKIASHTIMDSRIFSRILCNTHQLRAGFFWPRMIHQR